MAAEATPATGPCRMKHPPFDAGRRQVFVIGNEAADVDSLVSAYAMAALLDSAEVQGVALAQIPREEFRLRGDALALFRRAGCKLSPDGSPAEMRFWDEVDWDMMRGMESRSLVLTDHNKMAKKVAEVFEGRVEWVLDHHSDTKSYPIAKADIDERLGSCCTLVVEQFLAKRQPSPQEVGVLLAGVIILDARNFDPNENKGTSRDRAALDQLSAFLPKEGAATWYEELMHARRDVSHLSPRELLLLDLKATAIDGFTGTTAFCAIFLSLDKMCAQAGGPEALAGTLRGFARDRGHEAVVALFHSDETGLRALALAAASPTGEAICAAACPAERPDGLLYGASVTFSLPRLPSAGNDWCGALRTRSQPQFAIAPASCEDSVGEEDSRFYMPRRANE